ncbi:hypothetical protein D9758_009139 [Tetrapyrgos nigripes]|uniref:Uncharacterized protein n=1 Tax=Tetrapyrgos nigripes TaxID=182062 RepID=A0A8H5G8E0_9AGAR|nr:hypothetical protein D9758_009139 [Tetrapyrgos nigripes]
MHFQITTVLSTLFTLACFVRALPYGIPRDDTDILKDIGLQINASDYSDLTRALDKRFPPNNVPDHYTAKFNVGGLIFTYTLTRRTGGTTGVIYGVSPHFMLPTGAIAAVAKTIITSPAWNTAPEAQRLQIAGQLLWHGSDQNGRNWIVMKDMIAAGYRSLADWMNLAGNDPQRQFAILMGANVGFIQASERYLNAGMLYSDINVNNIFLAAPQDIYDPNGNLREVRFGASDFIDFDPQGALLGQYSVAQFGGTTAFRKSKRDQFLAEVKATYPHLPWP